MKLERYAQIRSILEMTERTAVISEARARNPAATPGVLKGEPSWE